jgi:hypothetical protein
MTATNHVLTGSVFALSTATVLPWWLILPVAFVLHFVLDAMPHFGDRKNPRQSMHRLKWLLPADATLGATVLLLILVLQPAYWLLALAGGILCASPDLWSTTRFIRFFRYGDISVSSSWFAQFHHRIQWGERLWGAWVELAWFLAFGYILITKL